MEMDTNEREKLIIDAVGKKYDEKILEKLTKLNHQHVKFLSLDNNGNFRKFLDTGAFGIVDLVRYKAKLYAHKRALSNNNDQYHSILDEALKLSEISGLHPNIQQIRFVNIKTFGFLMDYCDCGSLDKFIKNPDAIYTFGDVLSWSYQLADALSFLHSKNLMHRDVKLQNILLKDNYQTLVLTDYGSATNLGRSLLTKEAGTPITMAPEVCSSTCYTEHCDIYSWAIVFWQLLSKNSSPYDPDINPFTLMIKVSVEKLRPAHLSPCPELILALLYRSWHSNPKERPSLLFIKTLLQFFSSHFPPTICQNSSVENNSNLSNRLQKHSPCQPRLHVQRSKNLYDEHRKKLEQLAQLEQGIQLKANEFLVYQTQNEPKYDHLEQLNKENQILLERIQQIKSQKRQ